MIRIPFSASSMDAYNSPVCSCPCLAVRFKLLLIFEITKAETGKRKSEKRVNSGLSKISVTTLIITAMGSRKINSSMLTTATSISPTSLFIRAIISPRRSLEWKERGKIKAL